VETEKIDNTATEFVRIYLQDVGPLIVCNYAEERDLLHRYSQGDETCFHRLIITNQYIVFEEVLYFTGRGIELIDLIQFGNVALIESLRNFAESGKMKGLKSFLHRNIYRRLQNCIANYFSLIRYPVNRLTNIVNYNNEKIFNQLEYYILPLAIYWENNFSDTYNNKDDFEYFKVPYLRIDNIEILHEYLESEDSADKKLLVKELKEGINQQLRNLKENEYNILIKFFGLDTDQNSSIDTNKTLQEIAEECGLTRERVRQIKEKAISRLKHKSRRAELLFLWECCKKMVDRNWYFPISNSRDLFFVDPFNEIVVDEKCAIKLLEEYVKPRKRKEFVKGVKNLTKHYKNIITSFLNKIGHITLKRRVIKHIKHVDNGMFNNTTFYYAINTSENIKVVNDYIGLKKHFKEIDD
jgi:RNA polymerase primary sigma factor|tara:strand:+ start:131 stop:1363 length:1233 start_codon:yes stop_codon:yes gene_type:complete